MRNVLLQAAIKLNRNRKQRKWWQRVVRTMGIAVVFCTTYALILPAITMEQKATCGFEAHEHLESCYTQQPVSAFGCEFGDGVKVIHTHDSVCYDAEHVLICILPEISAHTHTDSCYAQSKTPECRYVHVHSDACTAVKSVLVCGQEETAGHAHSAACTTESVLICGTQESEDHTHGESCYEIRETVCTLTEQAAHTHTDACRAEQNAVCELTTNDGHVHESSCYTLQLICGSEEVQLHAHEAGCYDAENNLICKQPQVVSHVHTEECLTQTEQTTSVLTCGLEVHIHDEECYPAKEEQDEYFCGSGVHSHVGICYDETGMLVCTIPEHSHDASCIVKGLDLNADVETEQQWQESIHDMNLTGNWPTDVLAVAQTQMGYQESEKNAVLADGQLKGYTRYGAWYGDPYGDWNTMFVSFCLNYAGVDGFPREIDANAWITAMEEKGLFRGPDDDTPNPGDLVFFDDDQKEDALEQIPVVADRMAIVAELIPATEKEPAKIRVIAGDYENQVSSVTCNMDDVTIAGYADMPVGELFVLSHEGADFTISVTVGRAAGIPDSAQLSVREIPAGSDEYKHYYQQSLDALMGTVAEGEKTPAVSFARFFDISFLVDGIAVEPVVPVDVQIQYRDAIEKKEEEDGMVVHFADSGVEILDADICNTDSSQEDKSLLDELTERFTGKTEQVDTFLFTQESFSVSGTILAVTPRAANEATRVNFDDLDGSGSTEYVIYTQYNGRYYAIAAPATGKTGQMVEIQVAQDGTVTWSGNPNIRWTFVKTGTNAYDITNGNGRYLHAFYNGNGSDIGVIGTYSKGAALVSEGAGTNKTFNIKHPSGTVYVGISGNQFQAVTRASNAQDFYIAALQPSVYHVWFDGTNGGMMSYYGAEDRYQAVDPANNTITLPESPNFGSSTKYDYVLNGWYDINSHTYHKPGEEVEINQHTVFYADWVAATYDVGQNNEHVVDSVDTNDFITTHVFDYNALFNVQSLTHTGTISATNHSETWTIVNEGTVPYNNDASLGFVFVDYDSNGDFSYPLGRDNTNINQGDAITSGILAEVQAASQKNLLDLLFDPAKDVIGKNYVGTGNYLFQYMDSTTENYDGIHDGYYYLDARLNAASYNQTQQRFYLYDYLERTSDSNKDGGVGQYSDFLPFNSPYLFDADQLNEYTDTIRRPGYEYDAKDGESSYQEYNSADDAATNYFFGVRTDIEFFLPNDTNTQDEYGNYGNISTRGEHMIFDFHGDDDVWVFVDGELLLDIGGLHGVMFGQIDFSTGTITVGKDGGTTETINFSMSEGTHHMTVYYMERGSSQSNCAIYFNIAPRYDLEITKEDIATANKLDGAVFSIFTDEAMTHPAELWPSFEAHENGEPSTNMFTVVDGVAKCWGISAGKTYYIYETTPPPGYPESDDMIRITLNNRGTATIEATTLHGSNEIATEGFAVIKQEVNDTLKIVALTVTNQKEGDTTEVRVEKTWEGDTANLPASITVYLTGDGEQVGRSARLNEGNGWAYTWTGLPKYRDDGIDEEIEYVVEEVYVPNYITTKGESRKVENYVDWVRVDQMSDSKTFLLVHNNQALTYDGSFGWMNVETAQLDESRSAQWAVTTDHDGFHLKNGLGYTLTYDSSGFYGVDNDAVALNQVFYYLNSRLVVHDHDVYYQFGNNGAVVREDGLSFQLYQKEVMTGLLTGITNVPVDEENQTYVEVSKVWGDGNDQHSSGAVIIRLYADGKNTGRYVSLNAANHWTGGFYDLSYYQADGTTPIQYTVVEDAVYNYVPEYSDPETLPGIPLEVWRDTQTLEVGKTYILSAGTNALGLVDGTVTTVARDTEDPAQHWVAENRNGSIILRNQKGNTYLALSVSTLTTSNRNSAVAVTMSSDRIILSGTRYLELGSGYVGTTTNASNASTVRLASMVEISGRPGTGYTVTNVYGAYELPNTGGIGHPIFTFGGLLMIAAALMYTNQFGRKRQKGGKYSR